MALKKSIHLDDESINTIKKLNLPDDINWSSTINNIIARYVYFVVAGYPYSKLDKASAEALDYLFKPDSMNDIGVELSRFYGMVHDATKYNDKFKDHLAAAEQTTDDFLRNVSLLSNCEKLAVIDRAKFTYFSSKDSLKEAKISTDNQASDQGKYLALTTKQGKNMKIDIDGKKGLYTKEQWQNDETILTLDDDSQEQVLKLMDTFDSSFFKKGN